MNKALLTAVQLQPACVVTVTLPVPPAARKLALVGLIEKEQVSGAPAACDTLCVKPAIVSEPLLEVVAPFAATGQTDAAGRIKKSSEGAATAAAGERAARGVSRLGAARLCDRIFALGLRYLDQPRDDRAVRQGMKEIAETRVRYG